MKQAVAVVALLALGAVGWAIFGDDLTAQARKTIQTVQSQIADTAQDFTNSVKPE